MAEPDAPPPSTVEYDVSGALKAGLTEAGIAEYLASKTGYDIEGARKAGLPNSGIIQHLAPPAPPPAAKEEVAPQPVSGTALGMAKAAGQTVLETVPKLEVGVGAMMKSAGQGKAVESRRDIDLMHRLDAGEEFGTLMKSAPNDLARLALAQYRRASPEEKTTMRQEAINTVAAPPNALERGGANVLAAGQHGSEEAKKLIPLTPEEEGRTSVVVAKTAASLLTFLAAAGPAGVPGMVAYGGVESYGKTYEEAKKAGATDEDATVAAAISGVVQGGLNAVPAHKALAVADQIPKMFKGEFIKTLTEMAKSGGTLLGFTQVSQLADNYIAKETFEPARDLKQGLGENMGATFGVGALLPVVPAVAARAFRPRTPAEVAKPVMEAKTTDEAIAAAQNTVAEGTPVDISEITRNAEYGTTTEQNQARLLKLFGGMNEGTVEQAGEGYHYRTEADGQEQTIPLKVWDPAKPLAEGETPQATISPDLAAAQRKHYDSLGVKVVYFENDARIPFDGAVDPRQPDTIFLSNDPQRNAAQIGAHEVTHLLENTTLPDGTNLGDLLHDQVRAGMTPEGRAYAEKLFGGTAPKREAFGPGVEGDSAHADAVVRHIITELGADIGAEAPKFQTFAPRVVEAIEQRYGADAAKGVLQKLIAGFKNALDTMRNFFSRADEHPEYGQTPTVSQHWVANLGEIHDTLAQMYAARFGDRVERENVALIEMRNKAQRERFLATGEAPQPGYVDPLAWALTLRRWHSELQDAGSDPSSVEKIKAAMVAERERLSKIGVLRDFADAARSTPAVVDFEGAAPTPAESPHTALLRQTEAAILGKVNGVEDRLTQAQAARLEAVRSRIAEAETSAAEGVSRETPASAADDLKFSPRQDERKEPFYSALTRGVEGLKLDKATPGQWEATIRNMPGVKAEERAWSGVEDWLKAQAKSVTKAEVLEHLRENEVQVSEIEKRAMPSADMQRNEIANRMYDTDYFQLASSQKHLVDEALDSQSVQGAKFSDFTLPGGENYRELLLTLPDKAGLPGAAAADNFRGVHWNEPNVLAHVRFNDRTVDGKRTLFLEEVQSDWHQRGRQNGYSWGDALSPEEGAQLKRLSEKREAGTSTPEEIQELRALHERQRAVEIGNKNRVPDAPFKTTWPELAMKRMLRYAAENGYEAIAWAPGAAHVERFSEALRKEVDHLEWEKTPEGIHLVGYKTFGPSTYHIEPGVARWLVLNERDQIVETHDGRADAEAAIKRLESAPDRESGGRQKVVDTTEKETVLSDAIGKALGQKIISDEGQKGTMSGKDLRIDDTGMAGFYDRMLPAIANKIGKKFGAKVENATIEKPHDMADAKWEGPDLTPDEIRDSIPRDDVRVAAQLKEIAKAVDEGMGMADAVETFGSEAAARALDGRLLSLRGNEPVHSILITPAMRESVMQGQPLFSPRITGENKTRVYTPEEQKAFENVGRTTEPFSLRQWINEAKDDLGRRILRGAVDRYIGIKESDPEGYMALRIANSTAAAVSAFKDLGTLKFDGHAYNIADRNGGVTNSLLRPLGDEAHDFIWWVAANRAERLKGEDRENLFGDTDIAALKKLNQGTVDFDYTLPNGQTTRSREAVYLDSLRKLDVFNRNAMDLAVDAGLLPRDKVDALWSNPFYVPFYRQAAEGDASFVGPNTNSSFVKKSAFKTLKGGSEKLNNDLWENAFGNWQHMIDASLRNRAVTHVLDVASRPEGGAARELTTQEANHLSDKEMKAKTVWIMKDGEKVNYLIEDPMLFKAATVLDPLSDPAGLMTAGRWFKKVLQVGVTANPMFAVRNLIRDTEQTLAVAPSSANVVKNIVTGFKMDDLPGALQNIARAVAARDLKALDISDEAASAIAGGGLMRLNAGTESGVSNVKIRDVLNTPEAVDGFWNYVKTVAHSYREAVGQSEDVNRLALYKHLRDQGVPHDAASFAARDLADFTLSGASPVVRAISQLVPFMNARIQGLYKVGRAAADADANVMGAVGAKVAIGMTKRIAYVLGAATVLSVALDQIYKDEEEYQKLTDYDRSTYYNFRFGKTWYHIPKGFEIAALSNIATDGVEAFFDKKMTKDRFFRDVWQNVDSNLNMNPIPQAVRPVYDVQTNTSGLGRHIEPMGMEKLQPDERYTARSTMAARGLSTTVNAGLRAIPGINVNGPSPIQIDYMANAYGGWLATTSLGLADKVVRSFTSEPARPAGDFWADVTQGMVTTEPKAASRYTEMLYQQGKSIEQAYATYRDMISRGQAAEAAKFFAANKDELQKHGLVSGLMRLESNLNKQQRLIENNPSMSSEQKKLQIQALNAAKNRAAQQGLEAR